MGRWRRVLVPGARVGATAGLLGALLWLVTSAAAFSGDGVADAVFGQSDFMENSASGCPPRSASTICGPAGIAQDPTSTRIFVSDGDRVLSWANTSRMPSGQAPDLVLGQPDFTSATCTVDAEHVCGARGLAFDSHGRLYVSDLGNNRVLRFSPPFVSGMAADLVIGRPDFTTGPQLCSVNPEDSPTPVIITTGRDLCAPVGLAVDAEDPLYVADAINDRVLRFDDTSVNHPAASLVLGQATFDDRSGLLACFGVEPLPFATDPQGMFCPMGVAVDSSGRVFVADSKEERVLRYNRPTTNGQPADLVIGRGCKFLQPTSPLDLCIPVSVAVQRDQLFITDQFESRVGVVGLSGEVDGARVIGHAGPTSADALSEPTDARPDFRGDLFVADPGNSRVLRFDTRISGTQSVGIP